GLSSRAGGDLELGELQLYGAGRVDEDATISCTHTPSAGGLDDLKDDDTLTACVFSAADVGSAGFALLWSFAADVEVTGVRPGAGASQSGFISACTLQCLTG